MIVPCWANSNLPMRVVPAPVKAPRSWPNSSLSSRSAGSAAQLTLTNGLVRRGDRRCSSRAITSLPTPLSPRSSTPTSLSATRSTIAITGCIAAPELQHGCAPSGSSADLRAEARHFGAQRLAFERVADGGFERRLADAVGVARLQDVVGRAQAHRLDDRRRRLPARQHDDLRRRMRLPDRPQRLDAVQVRHQDVQQDDVGRRAGPQALEQRRAAVEHLDSVALGGQKRLQIPGEGGVVVDDRQACGHAFPLSMGMDNARARPSPAVHTRPPSAVIRRCASATPSPCARLPRIERTFVAVQRRARRAVGGRPAGEAQRRRRAVDPGDDARCPPGAHRQQRGDGLRGAIHARSDVDGAVRRLQIAHRDAALGEHRGDPVGELPRRGPDRAGPADPRGTRPRPGTDVRSWRARPASRRAPDRGLQATAACRCERGAGSRARRRAASARRESAQRALVPRRSSRKAGTSLVARASRDANVPDCLVSQCPLPPPF